MIKSLKSFDGTKIVYDIKKGGSKYIVLLHGIGVHGGYWHDEAKFLHKKGFSLIIPDLRGHGKSHKPLEKDAYFLDNFAVDLDYILRKEKVNNVVLIGHSFGGVIAITYYKLYREKVDSMVLINTDYKVPLLLYYKYKFKYLTGGLQKDNRHSIMHCFDQLKKYAKSFKKGNKKLLANINIPVLFIEGTKDSVIPPKHMESMCLFLKDVELYRLKGDHHLFNEKPREMNRLIFDFLRRHSQLGDGLKSRGVRAISTVLLSLLVAGLSTPGFFSLFRGGVTGAAVVQGEVTSSVNWPLFITKVILAIMIFCLFLYSLKED